MRYAPLIRNLAGIVGGIALSASAGTAFAQSVPAAPMTTAQSAASPDILMAQIDVPTSS